MNEIAKQNNLAVLKSTLSSESVTKRFTEMLGKKAPGFITSITNAVSNSELLKKADVNSIVLASATAAAVDLPINQNLGYAAIIPFYDGKSKKYVAQMQIMRNGWVELAQRTGQVARIENEPVYEGELVSSNRFKGEYVFDETKRKSDKIVGYMAYMRLTNGFEKTVYWTVEKCKQHAQHYSQTFRKGYGLWVDSFDAMALKSVLKHLIVKYMPKSIELIKATEADQASFSGDIDNPNAEFLDNGGSAEHQEFEEYQEVVEGNEQDENVQQEQNDVTGDGEIVFGNQ